MDPKLQFPHSHQLSRQLPLVQHLEAILRLLVPVVPIIRVILKVQVLFKRQCNLCQIVFLGRITYLIHLPRARLCLVRSVQAHLQLLRIAQIAQKHSRPVAHLQRGNLQHLRVLVSVRLLLPPTVVSYLFRLWNLPQLAPQNLLRLRRLTLSRLFPVYHL